MNESTSSNQNSTSTIHITYAGDLYEVYFKGPVIARITCYLGGHHKQDCQYDDLPVKVQDKILDTVQKILGL